MYFGLDKPIYISTHNYCLFVYSSDVIIGKTYKYTIQTLLDAKASALSPQLEYTHGQPFCGNGQVDRYVEYYGDCLVESDPTVIESCP